MADAQTKKGKNGTKKYGRNTVKCAAYGAAHGQSRNRFGLPKRRRRCTPLYYYERAREEGRFVSSRKQAVSHGIGMKPEEVTRPWWMTEGQKYD